MEWYYQLIEQLAEWFMQLFFDPAYHVVREEKVQHIIIRKQQVVTEWWMKQKNILYNLRKQSEKKNDNTIGDQLNEWVSTNIIHSPIGYYLNYKWVELIQ